jgi:probable HAF family extracellular repeat protein
MTQLRIPGKSVTPSGINDAGLVVGQRQALNNRFLAFTWKNGAVKDLPSLGGNYSAAHDVNAAGLIVGQSRTATAGPFATLWVPK